MNERYLDPRVVSIYLEGSILKRLDDLCRIFNVNRSKLVNEFLDERISWYEESMEFLESVDGGKSDE